MIKSFFLNLVPKFKESNPTVKAFIVIGILLIIGIILRWDFIIEEVSKSFDFLNGDSDKTI